MAIRDYAIEVRVINPLEKERQVRSALHGPEMVFVGICYQNESHNPVEKEIHPVPGEDFGQLPSIDITPYFISWQIILWNFKSSPGISAVWSMFKL